MAKFGIEGSPRQGQSKRYLGFRRLEHDIFAGRASRVVSRRMEESIYRELSGSATGKRESSSMPRFASCRSMH